jgi:hypothetical protein
MTIATINIAEIKNIRHSPFPNKSIKKLKKNKRATIANMP